MLDVFIAPRVCDVKLTSFCIVDILSRTNSCEVEGATKVLRRIKSPVNDGVAVTLMVDTCCTPLSLPFVGGTVYSADICPSKGLTVELPATCGRFCVVIFSGAREELTKAAPLLNNTTAGLLSLTVDPLSDS